MIDIQQEGFLDMPEDLEEAAKDPRWDTILKGKRVLDVFRKKELPVIQVKEVKFRPATDENDYQTKLRALTRFLNDGNKANSTPYMFLFTLSFP